MGWKPMPCEGWKPVVSVWGVSSFRQYATGAAVRRLCFDQHESAKSRTAVRHSVVVYVFLSPRQDRRSGYSIHTYIATCQ